MGLALGPGAVLRITEGIAVMRGLLRDTRPHRHHAVQISVAIEGPIAISIGGKERAVSAVVLGPDRPHRISGGGEQLLILIEPESARGHALGEWLGERDYALDPVSEADARHLASIALDSGTGLDGFVDAVHAAMGIPPCRCGGMDARVLKAIEALERAPERKMSLTRLAGLVNISASRLEHLFSEGTGISLKRYLLWKRIIDAAGFFASGRDLTRGALDAGFFDSAHLSRAFKQSFGLRPSDIFKASGSVQVFRE